MKWRRIVAFGFAGVALLVVSVLLYLAFGDLGRHKQTVEDFVSTVMGIVPSDPRHAKAKAILQDNFDQSKASGANATDSLKATFQLACLSPTSVVVGL